jgi:hypothetical protein
MKHLAVASVLLLASVHATAAMDMTQVSRWMQHPTFVCPRTPTLLSV